MGGPDDTNPAIRSYGIPSCNACLSIASRRGFAIGQRVEEGHIEGFSHVNSFAVALIYTAEGFLLPVTIEELENRRAACA
jgi:hypothetical protein